jgi:uncharacterized repeat protein (TIGR01451 family)
MRKFYFSFLFLLFGVFVSAQNFNIRFSLESVDCQDNIVCYSVQLQPEGASSFNLAGQNYRIYWNALNATFVSGSSVLPVSTYSDYTQVGLIENFDATGFGPLSFEANLSFLNYFIELNNLNSGGIVLAPNDWTTTSILCFEVSQDVIDDPDVCMEAVFARSTLTNGYGTAFVEVARWTAPNMTVDATGVSYFDLESGSDPEACVSSFCEEADLRVQKFANNMTPAIGSQITFSIVASNLGQNDATGVLVLDLLPAGYTFVSANASKGSYNNNTGVWTIGDLDNGDDETLQIVVTVNATGSYTNTAIISGDQFDPVPENNIFSVFVFGLNYDLNFSRVSLDCDTREACYAVQVRPNGAGNFNMAGQNYRIYWDATKASYVSGSSVLPTPQYTDFELVQLLEDVDATGFGPLGFESNLSFINYFMDLEATNTGGIVLAANQWTTTSILCFEIVQDVIEDDDECMEAVFGRFGLTDGYATAFMEIARWVQSDSTVNATGIIYNDLNSANGDEACFDDSCLEADLQVFKDVDNPIPPVGSQITFTVIASNNGPSNASGVVVNDPILSGFNFISATATKGSYNNATGLWTIGTLDVGEVQTVQITVLVNPSGSYTNTAVISGNEPDPVPENNSFTISVNALNYDVQFSRNSFDCDTREVCYAVQLRPNGSGSFNLAGQNYRIYWDATKATYLSGQSLLPTPQYTDFDLAQLIENTDASGFGPLPFESTLSFINYFMDLEATATGGITLSANQWTTTSILCFELAEQVFFDDEVCMEAVFARFGLTEGYATAFMEVARWVMADSTAETVGVLYNDLNAANGDEACFTESCKCENPILTIGNFECNGNFYSVQFFSSTSNVIANAGNIVNGRVENIPIGTTLILTAIEDQDCETTISFISPPVCNQLCIYPDLSAGQGICLSASLWEFSFAVSPGASISVNAGTITGNTVTNIPIGTNVTITATDDGCTVSITVISPEDCRDICETPPVSIGGALCLSNGNYEVVFEAVSGAVITATAGTVLSDRVTNIPAGVNVVITINFADCGVRTIQITAPICANSSLGDFVWEDLNGNGIQDPGEPGIPNVQVNLFLQNGTLEGTTTTNNLGRYQFDNLTAGVYYIQFVKPNGFDFTLANIGANDNIDSDVDGSNGLGTTSLITLPANTVDLSWDAGLYRCAQIGELVWYDVNMNDKWDSFENGINGLPVYLWKNHFGEWILWDQTVTGHKPGTPSDDGYFKFCVIPGEYYVEIPLPPYGLVYAIKDALGFIPLTNPNEQTNDSDLDRDGRTDVFTVTSGQMLCNIGAGFYPMATAGTRVWYDENGNGIRDAGEPPMGNIKVEAFTSDHEKIAETFTGSDGIFELEYLPKGDHYLKFTAPDGLGFSQPVIDLDEGNKVENMFGPGTTRTYNFQPANHRANLNAGISQSVLPTTFVDVRAVRELNNNKVVWITAEEKDVEKYQVFRRLGDNSNFVNIGEVAAKGNGMTLEQHYMLDDHESEKGGIYYYYIQSVDFDGRTQVSRTVQIIVVEGLSVKLFPNPAKDLFNISISSLEDVSYEAELFNESGQFVRSLERGIEIQRGQSELSYDIRGVQPGAYVVRIKVGSEKINKKLIIIR